MDKSDLFRDCFANYVGSKIIKRMDSYKVRGKEQPRMILLPLSFGVSSVTLLHVLDQQLRTQLERTSRTGYKIHVLFVDQPHTSEGVQYIELLASVKQRYPLHEYSFISLENIFDYDLDFNKLLPILSKEFTDSLTRSNRDRLKSLFSSLFSASSKADITSIIRTRLITVFAQNHNCEDIVWGDTTTRLAEKTLSEIAKGKGYSLSWLTADGDTPYGIRFAYPMRDLLNKEVASYSEFMSPPLTSLIVRSLVRDAQVSSKSSTIDSLMSEYFRSVERDYPSIVTNVVRTASRLNSAKIPRHSSKCGLCGMPFAPDSLGMSGWSEGQWSLSNLSTSEEPGSNCGGGYCYGCEGALLHARTHH